MVMDGYFAGLSRGSGSGSRRIYWGTERRRVGSRGV